MKVKLTNVRAAFLSVFEAKAFNDGKPTFSGKFIIDPKSANVKLLDEAIAKVHEEKWPGKAKQLAQMVKDDKVCFRKDEYKNSSGDPYDGFQDMFFISASNPSRPLIIDADKSPLVQADGKPYSGCYVNIQVDIWPQDNKFGKRINATLTGVQFVKDGDAFSGAAPASEDDFDVVAGADEDDLA